MNDKLQVSATSLQRFEDAVVGIHYYAFVFNDNGMAQTRGMVEVENENEVLPLSQSNLTDWVISKINAQDLEQYLLAQIPEPVIE